MHSGVDASRIGVVFTILKIVMVLIGYSRFDDSVVLILLTVLDRFQYFSRYFRFARFDFFANFYHFDSF